MRIYDDNPDVARHLEQIEIRALERLARELRREQWEGRGDNGAFVGATSSGAPLAWNGSPSVNRAVSPQRRYFDLSNNAET